MGNYSYLLKVILGKETKIDYEKLKEELNKINSEYRDTYLYCLTEETNWTNKEQIKDIENFEDYANRIHDCKLCGYLTPGTIKKLCKSGLCMATESNKNPIMYFEEEGWDRLHYFKFFPGTEKVEHGTCAFDFDMEYYEQKFKNGKDRKIEEDDDELYEYTKEKRNDYMYNLIYDPKIKWNTYILDYTKKENNSDLSLSLYMTLLGIRSEDMKSDPEKYSEIMKDLLSRK